MNASHGVRSAVKGGAFLLAFLLLAIPLAQGATCGPDVYGYTNPYGYAFLYGHGNTDRDGYNYGNIYAKPDQNNKPGGFADHYINFYRNINSNRHINAYQHADTAGYLRIRWHIFRRKTHIQLDAAEA